MIKSIFSEAYSGMVCATGELLLWSLCSMNPSYMFSASGICPGRQLALNLLWLHLPLRSLSIPDEKFDIQWAWTGPRLGQWLRMGNISLFIAKRLSAGQVLLPPA
jgi:hypothetical protein